MRFEDHSLVLELMACNMKPFLTSLGTKGSFEILFFNTWFQHCFWTHGDSLNLKMRLTPTHMLALPNRDGFRGRSFPVKPKKATFSPCICTIWKIIYRNKSGQSPTPCSNRLIVTDTRTFYCPLFCHSRIVLNPSSFLQERNHFMTLQGCQIGFFDAKFVKLGFF